MDLKERPNRFPWPPVLAAVLLVLGLLTRLWLPDWRLFDSQIWIGAAIALIGLLLILFAFLTFIRAQSNILPNKAADKLITHGAFRLSRNPIYTGEVLALGGIGIALGAYGLVAAAMLLAVLVQKLGIEREETHMAARFGADWEAYRSKVRRWL
jgi:protein-S-isoprenylcysteine O-methyltransferase Ste14